MGMPLSLESPSLGPPRRLLGVRLGPAEGVAEAAEETGARAGVGAGRVPAAGEAVRRARAVLALLPGLAGAEDVASAATTRVAHGRLLLAHLCAGELLVERDGGTLGCGMRITGTAPPRVEAAGAAGRGLGLGRNASGGGGGGSPEHVSNSSSARVGVAVGSHGGVRLGDGVVGHSCGCVYV
jgi:hypothetical protein